VFSELNWYFWVAEVFLTLSAFISTQDLIKKKEEGWKLDIFIATVVYIVFSFLMLKMTTT